MEENHFIDILIIYVKNKYMVNRLIKLNKSVSPNDCKMVDKIMYSK